MTRSAVRALLALAAFAPAAAAGAADDIGATEYAHLCARCHGAAGKGDGWFAEFLRQPPPPLTRLSRDNGGVFPFERVRRVIDGRTGLPAHGRRDMPAWGTVYRSQSARRDRSGLVTVDESVVRARILALVEHVSRLQE